MVTALADAAPDGSECWNCSELYYELGRLVIVAPPLHERLDDLGCLAEYFLRYWSRRLAKRVYRISPSAVELLRSRPWPGNLRQLSTIVCQAVAHAGGGMLQAADFPASSQVGNSTSLKEMSIDLRAFVDEQLAAGSTAVYRDALEAMEQRLLKQVLKRAAGNQAHAAKALGIARSRLRQKLRQHGIVIDRRAEVREMPTASVP
jgi:DNA-binding NtrC family response regulator